MLWRWQTLWLLIVVGILSLELWGLGYTYAYMRVPIEGVHIPRLTALMIYRWSLLLTAIGWLLAIASLANHQKRMKQLQLGRMVKVCLFGITILQGYQYTVWLSPQPIQTLTQGGVSYFWPIIIGGSPLVLAWGFNAAASLCIQKDEKHIRSAERLR